MRLRGHQLTCIRGERSVFENLNFEVRKGEALAVTGRNGSGKSSLLRMLAGLIPVAAGEISFDGEGVAEDTRLVEQAHYLGHRDALKPQLSVLENLAFWQAFLGRANSDADDALSRVGLGNIASLPAAFLSAGQRRRLSIARLIAVKRPVWLLDEPSSALDDSGQAMLIDAMSGHLASGGLIVAATHIPLGLGQVNELRLGAEWGATA
jgi:heme exporter protein A